ncbi:CENPX protein, partial [Brachypteracias leptosomus]|nr:CENPX protein [Brachypteracias leptosomus]
SPALVSAQETVDRLLRLHFRDGKTRVNGDAQLLMAEMLKVFVRGERPGAPTLPGLIPLPERPPAFGSAARAPAGLVSGLLRVPPQPQLGPSQTLPTPSPRAAEAAARAARQAQAEDLREVEVEQVEKVLPQLVRD